MGTSGVPFNPDKSKIVEAIKHHKGVITRIAEAADCDYITIKRYIDKHPDLQELLANARQGWVEALCDVSEKTILEMATQRQDLSVALKSSQFALTHQGKKRGYSNQVVEEKTANLVQVLEMLQDGRLSLSQLSSLAKDGGSTTSTES